MGQILKKATRKTHNKRDAPSIAGRRKSRMDWKHVAPRPKAGALEELGLDPG